MNYPVAYAVISEEEMSYISGGKSPNYKGLFDYMMGDYLRDTVKGDIRNAVWNSAKQTSFKPLIDWFKSFGKMGIVGQAGYIYGGYHLWEAIKGYLG